MLIKPNSNPSPKENMEHLASKEQPPAPFWDIKGHNVPPVYDCRCPSTWKAGGHALARSHGRTKHLCPHRSFRSPWFYPMCHHLSWGERTPQWHDTPMEDREEISCRWLQHRWFHRPIVGTWPTLPRLRRQYYTESLSHYHIITYIISYDVFDHPPANKRKQRQVCIKASDSCNQIFCFFSFELHLSMIDRVVRFIPGDWNYIGVAKIWWHLECIHSFRSPYAYT